jgi:hypothetical protein
LKPANHFWAVLPANSLLRRHTNVSGDFCSFGASTELIKEKVSEMFIFLNLTLHSFDPENVVPLSQIGKFQKGFIDQNESYKMCIIHSQPAILVGKKTSKTKPARIYAPTIFKLLSEYRLCLLNPPLTSFCYVGFEVLTAVVMKSSVFWDITPCNPLKINRHFGGTFRLHVGSACYPLHAGFLLGIFFDPEDGGDMFLRNVG